MYVTDTVAINYWVFERTLSFIRNASVSLVYSILLTPMRFCGEYHIPTIETWELLCAVYLYIHDRTHQKIYKTKLKVKWFHRLLCLLDYEIYTLTNKVNLRLSPLSCVGNSLKLSILFNSLPCSIPSISHSYYNL